MIVGNNPNGETSTEKIGKENATNCLKTPHGDHRIVISRGTCTRPAEKLTQKNKLKNYQNILNLENEDFDEFGLISKFDLNPKLLKLVRMSLIGAEMTAPSLLEHYFILNEKRINGEFATVETEIQNDSREWETSKQQIQETIQSAMMCVKCHVATVSVLHLPCGHMVTCGPCGMRANKCVECDQIVSESHTLYV